MENQELLPEKKNRKIGKRAKDRVRVSIRKLAHEFRTYFKVYSIAGIVKIKYGKVKKCPKYSLIQLKWVLKCSYQ